MSYHCYDSRDAYLVSPITTRLEEGQSLEAVAVREYLTINAVL